MPPRPLLFVGFRLLIVTLLVSLFSFVALDQPVLRSLYQSVDSAKEATVGYFEFLINIYEPTDTLKLVAESYYHSFVLLVTAVGLGSVAGVLLGFVGGMRPGTRLANLASSVSFIGVLTPSFLLALLGLFVFIRYVNPYFGVRFVVLSPGAEILELRRLLPPAIVLSVRPMAYMAQVTISALHDVVHSDYIRTASSKGLLRRTVLMRHIVPNIAQPVLTGLGSSFVFSLSSLLVVELLFTWYGVGLRLLDAVENKDAEMTAYLLASIGITVVLINTAINFLIRRFDPRVREPELAAT